MYIVWAGMPNNYSYPQYFSQLYSNWSPTVAFIAVKDTGLHFISTENFTSGIIQNKIRNQKSGIHEQITNCRLCSF